MTRFGPAAVALAVCIAPMAAQQSQPAPQPANSAAAHQLVVIAEQAYQSGLSNYRQNKVENARADFDRAIDTLLAGNMDVRNTPELSEELDKLLDQINQIEMASLEQGGGLVQQAEESPGEEANNVTFPVDPNLRAAAEAEVRTAKSDLPLLVNEPVASFISYFSQSQKGRATLTHSLDRSGRYRDMIFRVLTEEGVPKDLIYQAVAESGFQPRAFNRSGAAGMWQFIPGTGAMYGLRRDSYMDERYDPEKATRAYARYMKALYAEFGDWWLAMAAYDWGSGGVTRAVQKTGYANFWDLHRLNVLPAETKNYVPIILAAAIIAKNPQQYGLTSLNPAPPALTDTVTTHSAVGLRLVADLTNANVDDIVGLNPALTRLSTPPSEDYDLRLPAGTAQLYQERIARIPEEHRDAWRYHVIAAGETLQQIAERYRVSADTLAAANSGSASSLEEGQGLIVPVSAAASAGTAHAATRYTARKGDTVVSIADRFGVTTEQLRKWNGLKTNAVTPGRALLVASPSVTRPASARPSHGARRGTSKASSSGRSSGKSAHAASGTAAKKSSKRKK